MQNKVIVLQQLKSVSWQRWLVWGSSLLFVLFQFCLQLSSGILLYSFMKSFHCSTLGASVIASAYYFVYVALQIPSGMLVNRFGPRLMLCLGGLICAWGCFMLAFTHSFTIAILARLLMGTGLSCAFVSSLTLVGNWFPSKFFGLLVGVTEAFAMISTVAGGLALAAMISLSGWRIGIYGAAAMIIVITIMGVFIIKDHPAHARSKPKVRPSLLRDIRIIAKKTDNWLNGIIGGIFFALITVFAATWGIPYFNNIEGYSITQATFICSMLYIGVAVGGPIMGWLCNRLSRRRPTLIVGAIACTAIISLIIYIPHLSMLMYSSLMFLLGMTSSVYIFNYSMSPEYSRKASKSACIGFTNTLIMVTAPILQLVVGIILHVLAVHHAKMPHLQTNTPTDYMIALSVFPVLLIFAAYLSYKLPESFNAKITAPPKVKLKIRNNIRRMAS